MMITRLMVALLALYLVSDGGKNWNGLSSPSSLAVASDSLPDQALLAKQALDFCLTHREICAEAAGRLVKSTGSLPSAAPAMPAPAMPATAMPAPPAGLQAAAPGEPAPHLPLPPRRRTTPAGA
ncbi:MAG: hypothetical protein IOC52_07225 [Methylobacterium sp.]|nr:hypothetical protein [Methylobacterium sp.]